MGLRKGKERNWELCGKRRKDRYHACLDHFDTHHLKMGTLLIHNRE